MPDEIMKETLQFLRDLSKNNNKNWFDANKDRYPAAKSSVETLAGELLSGIRSFDDTVGPLSPKDCTYRIYRDLRFSKDKTPYKTHMGLYINQGGKKSGYSAQTDSIEVTVDGDKARLIGRSRVNAAVYGGGRHTWPLQMDSRLERIDGQWKIVWTKASTY